MNAKTKAWQQGQNKAEGSSCAVQHVSGCTQDKMAKPYIDQSQACPLADDTLTLAGLAVPYSNLEKLT